VSSSDSPIDPTVRVRTVDRDQSGCFFNVLIFNLQASTANLQSSSLEPESPGFELGASRKKLHYPGKKLETLTSDLGLPRKKLDCLPLEKQATD